MSELVGLEVLYSSQSSKLHCKSDALVLAIHWTLVLGGLRTIIEEDGGGGEPSELLPSGWNDKSEDVYTLSYIRKGKNETFLVKIVFADGILIVSSLKDVKKTASISLTVDDFVSNHNLPFRSVYCNLNSLRSEIEEQILEIQDKKPLLMESTRRQGNSGLEDRNPLGAQYPHLPFSGSINYPYDDDRRSRLPDVGRGDLHPLGGPPGMLMDPRSLIHPSGPENLPRGTIPGARFDPYGPPAPDNDRRRNPPPFGGGPTPDHLPPPGYDDMFL